MNTAATLKAPFLWVALDGFSEDEHASVGLVNRLNLVPGHFGFKINGDALYAFGIPFFQGILPEGRRKFADIKMWNGARTMARTFHNFHQAGFDAVNVWAYAGGYEDENGKGAELKRAITMFRDKVHGETSLKIYALTVLSHYNDTYCMRHFRQPLAAEVRERAEEAVAADADAIILPGTQLAQVAHLNILKITTGLRTPWYRDKEQEQEVGTEDIAGRDDLEAPCGSPITKMVGQEPLYLRRLLTALQK